MSRSLLGALALTSALLLATGCSSLEGTGSNGYISGNGDVQIVKAVDRGDPIEYAGEDLDGDPIAVSDFRGKPTVLNVWGSWCAECVAEASDLVDAAEELGDTASFVGINLRDPSTAQALSHDRKYGVEYPSFYEPDGKALLAFPGVLSPRTVPATVVLDAEGRVAASIIGPIPSTQTLVDVVEDVAADG
ncbi:TlpA disulfide reductase family protein [Nocardioides sp. SR21]|uniref:TlpA family protein disulfide reductase n=1 Tax=Nocardioides sp. SR21 TaxID=2919501 RepID=UPI001FAB1EB7|nr:TlpA disulfide reductase family protein [Nocardioides sp. SR21]